MTKHLLAARGKRWLCARCSGGGKGCADFIGWQCEYHYNCPLDHRWLKFAEGDHQAFTSFLAADSTDAEVAVWIGEHAKKETFLPRHRLER